MKDVKGLKGVFQRVLSVLVPVVSSLFTITPRVMITGLLIRSNDSTCSLCTEPVIQGDLELQG